MFKLQVCNTCCSVEVVVVVIIAALVVAAAALVIYSHRHIYIQSHRVNYVDVKTNLSLILLFDRNDSNKKELLF